MCVHHSIAIFVVNMQNLAKSLFNNACRWKSQNLNFQFLQVNPLRILNNGKSLVIALHIYEQLLKLGIRPISNKCFNILSKNFKLSGIVETSFHMFFDRLQVINKCI